MKLEEMKTIAGIVHRLFAVVEAAENASNIIEDIKHGRLINNSNFWDEPWVKNLADALKELET